MQLEHVNVFKNLESLTKIRQREVFCPIAKVTALNTPLIAADDLMLKTTMSSVAIYDKELSKIIYNHTEFPEIETNGTRIAFEQFIENISYLDRQVLLWGIFDATYGTLGKREISCPFCANKFEDDIKSEELLQPDSLTAWDLDQSFVEYTFMIDEIVDIPNVYKLQFIAQLPSIKKHLDVLTLLTTDQIQNNFDNFGSLFSKVEELSTVISSIKVFKTIDDERPDTFDKLKDIYFVIRKFLLLSITSSVLQKFNNHFAKFIPSFKKPYTCGECGKDFDFRVDMEINLFRRFLETE